MNTNGSNDFVIQQNSNSQRIILNVKDGTGTTTNTASLGASQTTGWLASSTIGRAMTATSTSTNANSCGVFGTAYLNSFIGKSNAVGLTNGVINLGISATSSYNNITSANDAFVCGANTAVDLGALTLTTWSSSRLGIRINSNSVNSVEVAGSTIQLNATTTGGLTSSTTQPAANDSSTKVPTTAWVQSAITSGAGSPVPYYQAYYFSNAPAQFDRAGYFQFNFTGANWGVNDFFTFELRVGLTTTAGNSTALAPNFTVIFGRIDVYPNRCPANIANPSAYGVNPNQPNVTNFSLTNGSIYDGSTLQPSYVVTSAGGPYAPFGRWYWTNSYSITSQGTQYPTSSPSPLAPYIAPNTAAQSAFGLGIWQTQLVQSNFSIWVNLINRGPGGAGQGITLSSNYSTSGGSTIKEYKVGL
jgi:hypothetical protein